MESEPNVRSELESLTALREYVSKAVDEIVRLRAQNTALARRLSDIEDSGGSGNFNIAGATSPDELRARITGFIDAIDRYLSEEDDDEDDEIVAEGEGRL